MSAKTTTSKNATVETVAAAAAPVAPQISPIVAAMLAGSNRKPLFDRLTDSAANTLNEASEVTGRLWEAIDTDRFEDGIKQQKLRNMAARQARWAQLQRELGLSDDDVAAIIAS